MLPQEEIEVTIRLNGDAVTMKCDPRMHLADFIRHLCHKTGTHVGCEHGVCGACTVLLNGRAVRSCLMYAPQVDGAEIETVEGLARDDQLNLLQQKFRENFALQCGFCTPGILMSATDYLSRNSNPTEKEVREFLSGHICRCTGYDGIVRAILAAARQQVQMPQSSTTLADY